MPKVAPVDVYILTDHARLEMKRRGTGEAEVAYVLAAPEQAEVVRAGRTVYQSRVASGEPGRLHLLRVFVDLDRVPARVVTAYRTSKVDKYWRNEP